MGLFSKSKPKIKVQTTKRDGYSGWIKCVHCSDLVHIKELQENKHCCPKCDYHYRLTALQRIELLTDSGSFIEMFRQFQSVDPLTFVDSESYFSRLEKAKKETERDEAVMVGSCQIKEMPVAIGALDFSFMAGSMGSVVGERITSLIEYASKQMCPLILVSASGGARMQESILSLMQMAKISSALAKFHELSLSYISILTNPTTGGVTASFAALGDIILAEPGALIGFAGPRVVEQTTRQKLPDQAQKSEFLLERGMIDVVVSRHQLKDKLSSMLSLLQGNDRKFTLDRSSLMSFDDEVMKRLPQKLQTLLTMTEEELADGCH